MVGLDLTISFFVGPGTDVGPDFFTGNWLNSLRIGYFRIFTESSFCPFVKVGFSSYRTPNSQRY